MPTFPQSSDVSWLAESVLIWWLEKYEATDQELKQIFTALRSHVPRMVHSLEATQRTPPEIIVECDDQGMRTYPRSGISDLTAHLTMRWPFNTHTAAEYSNAYSAMKSAVLQADLKTKLNASPYVFGVKSVAWDVGETRPAFQEDVWERTYGFTMWCQPLRSE